MQARTPAKGEEELSTYGMHAIVGRHVAGADVYRHFLHIHPTIPITFPISNIRRSKKFRSLPLQAHRKFGMLAPPSLIVYSVLELGLHFALSLVFFVLLSLFL